MSPTNSFSVGERRKHQLCSLSTFWYMNFGLIVTDRTVISTAIVEHVSKNLLEEVDALFRRRVTSRRLTTLLTCRSPRTTCVSSTTDPHITAVFNKRQRKTEMMKFIKGARCRESEEVSPVLIVFLFL